MLGKTYPKPIVDHAFARARALKAFDEMRGAAPDAAEARLKHKQLFDQREDFLIGQFRCACDGEGHESRASNSG